MAVRDTYAANPTMGNEHEQTENRMNLQGDKVSLEEKLLNRKLYDRLVDVIGTEEEIRLRQRLFQIMDIVNGFGDDDSISVSSGSLAEGLNIKGSDEDQMHILKYLDVVPAEASTKASVDQRKDITKISMEMDIDRPGYGKLFLLEDNLQNQYIANSLMFDNGRTVVSSAKFRDQFIQPGSGMSPHGPCASNGEFDFATSLPGKIWPQIAKERIINVSSKHWISKQFAQELLSDTCVYVPVGPRNSEKYDTLWRVSFAISERKLTLSMNHVQMLCYGLLKIILKQGIDKELETNDLLCSYFMKTCLFWLIEETDNDKRVWCESKLFSCFTLCLDKLIQWVDECKCPNYFIPGENMFFGKVHEGNKGALLLALKNFRFSGYECLAQCESLVSFLTSSKRLSEEEREANMDFLCYRVVYVYPFDSMELARSALEKVDAMYMSESHHFTKGILNRFRATLNQELAQMLLTSIADSPQHSTEIRRQQREHLLKACSADVCCGLSLLASFYHKQGRHYTALEILNAAIRKLTPSVLLFRNPQYSEVEKESYVSTMCGRGFNLEHKMKCATVSNIVFLDNSSLMPIEFQPEVEKHRPLSVVPSNVFAYALKFLCYHHLNDEHNKGETLRSLQDIVDRKYLIFRRFYSLSLTFLGACYEVNGERASAKHCYLLALDNPPICKSAKYRLDRLGWPC